MPGPSRHVLATLVLALVPAVSLGALVGPADARGNASTCSTHGLRFTRSEMGADFSIRVSRLRASGATCDEARVVAAAIARTALADGLPTRTRGYTVVDRHPCTACSPETDVKAVKGARRLTFTLLGGG